MRRLSRWRWAECAAACVFLILPRIAGANESPENIARALDTDHRARLRGTDGSWVELHNPRLVEDSLLVFSGDAAPWKSPVSFSRIQELQIWKGSADTGALVGGILVGAAGVLSGMALAALENDEQPDKAPKMAVGGLVGGFIGGALGAGAGALIGKNFHQWSTVYRSNQTHGSILITPQETSVSMTVYVGF